MLPPTERSSILGEIIQPYLPKLKPTERATDFPEATLGLVPVSMAFMLCTVGED